MQVGVGHAGSTDAKWRLDACIALIDVTMADEIFDTIDSRTSVVRLFAVMKIFVENFSGRM